MCFVISMNLIYMNFSTIPDGELRRFTDVGAGSGWEGCLQRQGTRAIYLQAEIPRKELCADLRLCPDDDCDVSTSQEFEGLFLRIGGICAF